MNLIKKIINWIIKAYKSPANIPRMIVHAFFFSEKNGGNNKCFSTKKFFAFIFATMAGYSKIGLVFWTKFHWTVKLTEAGVSEGVIIAIVASLDALAIGALGVYGWSKAKGAI